MSSENPNLRPPTKGEATYGPIENQAITVSKTESLFKIDVSGRNGRKGTDGTGQVYRRNNGRDGDDGVHGTNGKHGQKGGEIHLSLSTSDQPDETLLGFPFDGQVQAKGKILKAGSDRLASFGERVDLKLGKLVGLFAKGGSGGRGGAGGDGMNGSRGRSGSDASRFSSGSDGGPGGDGGDGGDGGHGGNGGGGGNILLSTPAEQTHLMMLARLDVKPGDAGIGGIGGAGGRGGSGGPGGSSYSWREKVGEDDNGHSIYRTYSNPGGSRGPSGSPGRDGSAGRSGQQGPKGKYAFGIETQTGLRRQPQHIFDLEVLSYEIVDAFEDGILEFGEQLYIRNLSVRNRGSMPMPASRNAYVYLLHSEWWAAEPIALTVPLELGPGESYTFSEELAVRVREARPDEISAKALQVKAMLRTESIMGGILLPFVHGRKQTPLDLRYPLEIRPVRGHHSIARGSASRLQWTIINQSQQPIGLNTLHERMAQSFFYTEQQDREAQLRMEHLLFFDRAGNRLELEDGLITELNEIEPGQEISISLFVGVHPEAEPMTTNVARTDLRLARPDDNRDRQLIQFAPFQLRVASTYRKSKDSDILLVINRDSHKHTVEGILAYYEGLGSPVDIWDISHYGYLDLEKFQTNGRSLLEDFEGKTILLLNHGFESNQQTEVYSSDFIDKQQFLRATNDFGIDIYLLGKTDLHGDSLQNLLSLPTVAPESVSRFEDMKAFWKALDNRTTERISQSEGMLDAPLGQHAAPVDNFSSRAHVIDVKSKTFLWGLNQPEETQLKEKAEEIALELGKRYPQEQFYVIYDYQGEEVKNWGKGFAKTYQLGTITIRQGPHKVNGGNLLGISVEEDMLRKGSFFEGEDAQFYLALGLTIWESQDILQQFLDAQTEQLGESKALDSLRRAILFHLVTEQVNLRAGSIDYLDDDEQWERLVFLQMVLNFSLGFHTLESQQSRFFQELFAHLLAYMEAQSTWLRYLVQNSEDILSSQIKDAISDWIDRNFDTSRALKRQDRKIWENNKQQKPLFEERMNNRKKEILQDFKAKVKKRKDIEIDQYAEDYYLHQVQTSAKHPNYVITRETYESWQAASDERQSYRNELQESETATIADFTYELREDISAGANDRYMIDPDS